LTPCAGHLVLHHDGTLLYCSEDLTEVACSDHAVARHPVVLRCWSVMPHGLCGYCREVADATARKQALVTPPPSTKSA